MSDKNYKFTNFAASRLAAAVTTTSQTAITLTTGDGANFPALTGDGTDYFMITVVKSDGTREMMHIVDRSTDTLTVGIPGSGSAAAGGRGYDNTSATTFAVGDTVELRLNAGALENIIGDVIVQEALPHQNLLKNSGLGVWSRSAAQYTFAADSDLVTNGGFDSATTGWTAPAHATLSSETGGQSGNCLRITENSGADPYAYQDITCVVGRFYSASLYVKAGDEATWRADVQEVDGTPAFWFNNESTGQEATGSWVQHTVYFVASNATMRLYLLQVAASGSGTYMDFDTVTCKEASPGMATSTAPGPDGYNKSSTTDIKVYRSQGTVPVGALYSMKVVVAAAGRIVTNANHADEPWIAQFRGRTVTLGAWVKTDTADLATISLYDGTTTTTSSKHTGGDTWEWLEVTATIATDANQVVTYIFKGSTATSGTAYVSCPMLVFGSRIGSGNYNPIPNEVIWTEGRVSLATLDGATGLSDTTYTNIYIEAATLGMIPKNAAAVWVSAVVKDSGSAAVATCILQLTKSSTATNNLIIDCGGIANDSYARQTAWVPTAYTDATPTFVYSIAATGSGTFDVPSLKVLGVQLI